MCIYLDDCIQKFPGQEYPVIKKETEQSFFLNMYTLFVPFVNYKVFGKLGQKVKGVFHLKQTNPSMVLLIMSGFSCDNNPLYRIFHA